MDDEALKGSGLGRIVVQPHGEASLIPGGVDHLFVPRWPCQPAIPLAALTQGLNTEDIGRQHRQLLAGKRGSILWTNTQRMEPTMTPMESVLRTYGNGIEPDDFADQLERVMQRRVVADPRALSSHDRDVLAAVGVPAEDLDRPAERTVVDEAAGLIAQNSLTLTAAEAASRLGKSVTRIRGAIADGSLYGVKVGRSWLLPLWQITDHQAAPLPICGRSSQPSRTAHQQ